LNSEGKNLGSGSGQQIVTAVTGTTTTNTLWWIRGPNDPSRYPMADAGAACQQEGVSEPIQCGQVIRLTHLASLKNLHSHNVRSPLSRQQEVSAYGEGDGMGDNGDDWKVVCNGKYWERSSMVSFQHVDSGHYLGASSTVKFTHQNCGHSCPIMNHLEVFGRNSKDAYGVWVVEMGIHLSK
jgi:dolichyl-phosphate-mannose--protein O-mannosyl transferase